MNFLIGDATEPVAEGNKIICHICNDIVANMVAQFGFDFVNGQPPIRYKALQQCLNNVAVAATLLDASVHMPKIGCGIAGGDWSVIEPIITYTLESKGIPVFVYTLPDSKGSPLDNKEV